MCNCSDTLKIPFDINKGFKIADMPQGYRAVAGKIDRSRGVTPPEYMLTGEYMDPYYIRGVQDNYLGLNELKKVLELIKNNAGAKTISRFLPNLSREDARRLKKASIHFQKLSKDPRVHVVRAIKKLKSMCKGVILSREWPAIARYIKTTDGLIKKIKPRPAGCKSHPLASANRKAFYRQAVEEFNKIKKTLARWLPRPNSTIVVMKCDCIQSAPELSDSGSREITRVVTASKMKRLKPRIYNSLRSISVYLEPILKSRYQLTADAYMKSFRWKYSYHRHHSCK